MKILFVNQTFHPDAVATAQHLTDLAIALKNGGHGVTVLTSRRGYSEPHPTYPAVDAYQGVQIVRVWPFIFGRKNKLIRTLDALCVNAVFFVRLLSLPKYDTIIALTSPPLVSFFACFVAKLKKSRFVYWVMDMNPDEAIAMGWVKEGSLIARGLKWCQAQVVRHSDSVVVLDRYMRDRLTASGKGDNVIDPLALSKIIVIPPWSHDEDLALVSHADNSFREKYSLDDKFVVMYSGNHSVCHPLDTVLEAAKKLSADPAVIFMFIGGGARIKDVKDFKTKHNLSNIIQVDYVPRSEIKFSLSAADLHLVVMGDPMAGIVHPCKIYGILSLGRPFIYVGPRESHIMDLIEKGVVGYAVRHGESDKLVERIKEMQRMPAAHLGKIMRVNQASSLSFSTNTLVPKMIEAIVKDYI